MLRIDSWEHVIILVRGVRLYGVTLSDRLAEPRLSAARNPMAAWHTTIPSEAHYSMMSLLVTD